jgi:phosphatidylinositol alpha-1,6-mannosyltransferase
MIVPARKPDGFGSLMGEEVGKTCLLVTNVFPPALGGSSQVYAALAACGEVAVLTSSHDHADGRERLDWKLFDERAGYPVHRVTCIRPFQRSARSGLFYRPLYRLSEIGTALKLSMAAARLAWRYRVKAICIADDETVGWLVMFAKHVLRRRALIYCHGDDLQGDEAERRRRSRWFGMADTIVAANRYAMDLLITRFGVPPQKIVLITNGVDLAAFYPEPPPAALAEQYGLEGRRVMLTLTRLVPRKGIDKVLEALPAVAAKFPDLLYLVVGEGPQREDLQKMTQSLGIESLVKFAGAVAHGETRHFYNSAQIVLLPNRVEDGDADGLPLVFLEANACARPVIGGKAAGSAEIIHDGENGVLVDGRDSGEIAAAICALLGDETRRAAMGRKGREMAQAWGWSARAQLFLQACRG